jgi:dihydropteroate synthase
LVDGALTGTTRATSWRLRASELDLGQPRVAGIVNVTDDSFFSGARSERPEGAIRDGLALAEAGFDMLDVGAVAARAGAPVPVEEEKARLIPVVEEVSARASVPVSADTFSPEIARAAAVAGAEAINDIGGGAPEMLEAAAETGCGYVLMHIEGPPRVDRPPPRYDDVVDHLLSWFEERMSAAVAAGIAEEAIALDPGLDFDLTTADDLEILRRLDELHSLGRPLFVALSRKDFLGAVLADSWEERLPPGERGSATLAAAALAVAGGAEMLRLHDVEALDAMRVAAAIAG